MTACPFRASPALAGQNVTDLAEVHPAVGGIDDGHLMFHIAPLDYAFRCMFCVIIATVGFLGLFILAGSIPFYLKRAGNLSGLLIECNLSLSFYPTGKIFTGQGRLLLLLTPAATTGVLPMQWIEDGDWQSGLMTLSAAVFLLFVALQVFKFGVRKYQSVSYVTLRT